ncbi:hypothetical protein [Candidatus Solirubrobacter pratensis]|uniref:hypothetical protein n=1 Tax=Candidatus Solirubrobacter pratensis TaxID=1298857 RepID=UPI000418C74A|nr:hypothetical protein [Candidatus Solirubrobacter pratensis]
MGEDTEAHELRVEEARREREERRLAEDGDPEEARAHERRADKHSYLREKLADRERSEND